MITVVKLNPRGEPQTRYQGEIVARSTAGIVIQAYWRHAPKELGYTRFEPGDRFTEYYYTDRWFNIFDIASAGGQRKGWYCNIAQPASISAGTIEQVDLLLDVWVDPRGTPLVLDEDEFAADTALSAEQRAGAQQGLQALLQMITEQRQPFIYTPLPGR